LLLVFLNAGLGCLFESHITNYVNPGSIADKSASDKERESWMIDQWVCLTEERNAVLVPLQGSGIPGAPPLEG